MQKSDIDLLSIDRGLVIAPAGCGKTQLIIDTLARYEGRKPILVLTHTNAGVAALRTRLTAKKINPTQYRLSTLDGWALRMATMFPQQSGFGPAIPVDLKYPDIRKAAYRLLKSGHITNALRANYARILVDEYQDCSIHQHAIVYYAAMAMPTCILGDPLQAIFNFGDDKLADWEKHVCVHFQQVGALCYPWRWANAGKKTLGDWILAIRDKLIDKKEIDLLKAPKEVRWIPLDGSRNDLFRWSDAVRVKEIDDNDPRNADWNDSVMIIGDSHDASVRHYLASQTPELTVVEPVDLKDMIGFAGKLDLKSNQALGAILKFVSTIVSDIRPAELLKNIHSISAGKTTKEPTEFEKALIAFDQQRNYKSIRALLIAIQNRQGSRLYRPIVFRAIVRALELLEAGQAQSLQEAAIRVREQSRMLGRPTPKRAIGSTLLLKGLESECVVILNGDRLDVKNLYVALTRGSKSIIVCSRSPVLNHRA